jgi:hypothetical protein
LGERDAWRKRHSSFFQKIHQQLSQPQSGSFSKELSVLVFLLLSFCLSSLYIYITVWALNFNFPGIKCRNFAKVSVVRSANQFWEGSAALVSSQKQLIFAYFAPNDQKWVRFFVRRLC